MHNSLCMMMTYAPKVNLSPNSAHGTKLRISSNYIIQICSGITRGRVFNGELYAQRLQKLICLHLSTDLFMEISLHSSSSNYYMIQQLQLLRVLDIWSCFNTSSN